MANPTNRPRIQRWRPPSFVGMPKERLPFELDRAVRNAYDQIYTSQAQRAQGSAQVTGSQLNLSTGLQTVTHVTVSLDAGATPINEWVTASLSSTKGAINIYVWAPTSAADNTPIASTTPRTVNWTAQGTGGV